MSNNRLLSFRKRVALGVVATAGAFLPISWLTTKSASAASNDEVATTTSTLPQPAYTGAPLLPTIPPTTTTTTIPVPVTFPPSPSTTAYPLPDPNAIPDSGIGVELPTTTTSTTTTTTTPPTTTTSTTSTTTSTIPATTTTSTVPVTTSTTTTVPATTTTAAPTTTSTSTSTVPLTTAPPTTAGPVIVTTTTTIPQPALAVTGSNDTKPLSLLAGAAVAAGFGLVFATGNGKGRRPAFAAVPVSGSSSATTGSSIKIDSPYSTRSAVSLVEDLSYLPAPSGAPVNVEMLRVVREPNVPVEDALEIEVSPAVGIEIPSELDIEAASKLTAPSRKAHRDARQFRAPSRDAFRAARAAEQASYAVVSLDELNASRVVGLNAIAL